MLKRLVVCVYIAPTNSRSELLGCCESHFSTCSRPDLLTPVFRRPAFVSKFAALRARWQCAAQGVRERKRAVAARVRQWRGFSTPEGDLLRFLTATGQLLSALRSQDGHSLLQTRSLIHELKVLRAAAMWGPKGAIPWQTCIPPGYRFSTMSWCRCALCTGRPEP